MTKSAITTFSYVTFIRATPERLWEAITTPEFTKQFWFDMYIDTDWKVGSPWKLAFSDGRLADTGVVVEYDPPKRLVLTWRNEWSEELKAEGHGRLIMELEPFKGAMKLSITHSMERDESKLIQAVSGGWPRILSNLKSLLETGEVVLKEK